jgi:adenine-specific DNA-methyltransferase
MTSSVLIKSKEKTVSRAEKVLPVTQSVRYKNLDADKLRGGYYTSEPIAKWLCEWAIQSKNDHVLEPSSGDGVFVEMAARRLMELGAESKKILEQIKAVEINEVEAKKVSSRLAEVLRRPVNGTVKQGDFFELWPKLKQNPVDCVVGNPPFIRYQTFPEDSRTLAMAIMEASGLKPNRLTNIWVPFVVAAMECLKPGGRLAMVLPAELLQVTYAAQLRSFLTDRFKKVDLVACNDLFFVGAQQEVVLVLADGALEAPDTKNTCAVTLTSMDSVNEIVKTKPEQLIAKASPKKVSHDSEKWLKYFLSAREISFMRRLRESESVTCLSTYASVEVGVVTGKNEFFVVNKSIVEQYQLEKHVLPLVGRSSHLAGAIISKKEWKALAENQERVHLFTVDPALNHLLSPLVKSYIKYGEENKFQTGYKCSIRDPWYSVPSLWVPDAFFFRQIYDFPRVVLNTAKGTSTDTIHRMRCHAPAKQVSASLYTHLTAASAEIEGRSYGGGVLELEPNEARRLLMPKDLEGAMPIEECDRLIRAGKLQDILNENDKRVLIDRVGLSQNECKMLRQIWEKMRDRRISRKKSPI